MSNSIRASLVALAAGLALTPALALDGPLNATYQASEIQLSRLMGRVEVAVGGTSVSLSITGKPEELEKVRVTSDAGRLLVEGPRHRWDFDDDDDDIDVKNLALFKLTVPRGTKLTVQSLMGEAKIGDVGGELKFSGTMIDAQIGRMRTASVNVAGNGAIRIADVQEKLVAHISGSGKIFAGNAASAELAVAGSGDITMRAVAHDLEAKISGSGDIKADSVNGAMSTQIAGSGSVTVPSGRADPFSVRISGHGDVDFGGTATNPDISAMGSGDVRIGAYTGKLKSRGQASLTIGQ
ncbi:MAG: DUF2807 domain-containing protein [Alphaproteobacteria bacterium]